MINRRSYGLHLFRWLEHSPTTLTKQQDAKGTRGPPASWLLTVDVISTRRLSGRRQAGPLQPIVRQHRLKAVTASSPADGEGA